MLEQLSLIHISHTLNILTDCLNRVSYRNTSYLIGELSVELALVPDSLSNSCCKMSAHSLLVIPFIGLCDFSGLVSWLSTMLPTTEQKQKV